MMRERDLICVTFVIEKSHENFEVEVKGGAKVLSPVKFLMN